MFVSSENSEPSAETAGMAEEVLMILIRNSNKEAPLMHHFAAPPPIRRRTSSSLCDIGKVSRLQTQLSWTDVWKSARDNIPSVRAKVHDSGYHPEEPVGPTPVGQKRIMTDLAYGMATLFSEQFHEAEEGEDEAVVEDNAATLKSLRNVDERARSMSSDRYASFTIRKRKSFRESIAIGAITDATLNDDIVDILGFLALEIVPTVTEEALLVKQLEHKVSLGAVEECKRGSGGISGFPPRRRGYRSKVDMLEKLSEDLKLLGTNGQP
ncbi:hypothetical protein HOY82DRAFT_535407 [Tuber indicum]|nr:hypothetical protein HOY82DRAFT_535407 [Tuber indicum]